VDRRVENGGYHRIWALTTRHLSSAFLHLVARDFYALGTKTIKERDNAKHMFVLAQ